MPGSGTSATDERHLDELQNVAHPGLWWPQRDSFERLVKATAETCEKYEAGTLTGDQAADIVFGLVKEAPAVNPAFGWKGERRRFICPSTLTTARFLCWASVRAPAEMNSVGRDVLLGIVKAGRRFASAAEDRTTAVRAVGRARARGLPLSSYGGSR
ncbi:hypothetical protein ACWC6I_42565 [Streptomyces sp. NPDC001414]